MSDCPLSIAALRRIEVCGYVNLGGLALSPWFHEEEAHQVGVIMAYEDLHPGTSYRVEFPDAETYIATYETEYESENSGDLGIEMDDPLYDEFYQVVFVVKEIVQRGPRLYDRYLTIDYRDFPVRVTNADSGEAIYPDNH